MKVILVDDERIALEHIKSLLPWDQYGFEIVASATNGKSALRLCEEIRPQIMIVDIRMPAMDGLELIKAISERDLGVKFIVMSAYEDFDYARQAISIGNVSSYLVKYEVDQDKLLYELQKAKEAWEADEKQRNLRRSEQLKDVCTGIRFSSLLTVPEAKPPFGMMMIHTDLPFTAIPPASAHHEHPFLQWSGEEIISCPIHPYWNFIGGFPLNPGQFVALFSPKNKFPTSMCGSLHEIALSIQEHLGQHYQRSFSLFYSIHNGPISGLPHVLDKLNTAAKHAVFCGKNTVLCADELTISPNSKLVTTSARTIKLEKLASSMKQNKREEIENVLNDQFQSLCKPLWDLNGLYETVYALSVMINEYLAARGNVELNPLHAFDEADDIYHIDEVRDRFISLIQGICADAHGNNRISAKLLKALHYIHDHYHEDINIEDIAYSLGISASYLHQLFKRELGRTFLDYLTEFRINQAKQILSQEDAKMTEVSARVGYRSPQYFSQVFKKFTGMLPHQFRHGGYHS